MGQMIYGVVCFATLLSFVGTVLGGIWADQSWGRFWGWDPKENGALLIVIWNALILHARWGGLVKQRGMAVLAVVGNMVTGWSWFGTNQLRRPARLRLQQDPGGRPRHRLGPSCGRAHSGSAAATLVGQLRSAADRQGAAHRRRAAARETGRQASRQAPREAGRRGILRGTSVTETDSPPARRANKGLPCSRGGLVRFTARYSMSASQWYNIPGLSSSSVPVEASP